VATPDATTENLLERLAWSELDERVRREQRNREVYTPAISMFRWWARRPHALIGALLDAAREDGGSPLVSDPFSGGGTVAIEAARRGLAVYAQDLHPWATAGLASTLDGADPDELERAARGWLQGLQPLRDKLYATSCPQHGDAEITHTFWVRLSACGGCDRPIYLYPYALLSLASRARDETHAWHGCRACGAMTRSSRSAQTRRCSACHRRLEADDVALLGDGKVSCPHPGCRHETAAFSDRPAWLPVLVQRTCRNAQDRHVVHLDRPTGREITQATLPAPEVPEPLAAMIPAGVETRRLARAGFETWADLYPPRQLATLLTAAAAVPGARKAAAIAARLRLAVCGAAEMAGYASRWDRYYPKAFEATANHRFAVTGFACETNLLSDRGRGTLSRRVAHSVRAARWAGEFTTTAAIQHGAGMRRLAAAPQHATVVRGSSSRQLLPSDAVDLVLTDPPYFDDVQYAELASLFLAWAQSTGLIARRVTVDLRSEAVANTARATGPARYRLLLTRILTETHRTLRADGRMILTYHNTDGRAWWSLGAALFDSGFSVAALAVAHAENETDHAKRGREAFSRDLILECRPVTSAQAPVVITPAVVGTEGAELLAAGRAVAAATAPDGTALRRDYAAFSSRFVGERGAADGLIRVAKVRLSAKSASTGSVAG
jgi:putative DNA methylase